MRKTRRGVAKQLQVLRERAGLRQADCAKALGITPDAYRHIEKGRTSLLAQQLPALASVLGTSVDDILEGHEEDDIVRMPSFPYRTELARLWNRYDGALQLRHAGNWREAELEAEGILAALPPVELSCLAALLLADCKLMQGRITEAMANVADKLDSLPDVPKLTVLRSQLIAKRGDLFLRQGHHEPAEREYRRCEKLLEDCDLPAAKIERVWARKRIAQILLSRRASEEALKLALDVREEMSRLDNRLGVSRALYVLGWAYQEEALRCSKQARRANEVTQRSGSENYASRASDYARSALGCHREGTEICDDIGDVEGKAKGLSYQAEDHRKLCKLLPGSPAKHLRESRELTAEALKALDPLGDGLLRGRLYRNFGLIELKEVELAKDRGDRQIARGHALRAAAHLQAALAMDGAEMPGRVPALQREIAKVHDCLGNPAEALRHLQQACWVADSLSHPDRERIHREYEEVLSRLTGEASGAHALPFDDAGLEAHPT